jgi:RNA-directed DNA polymerase
VLTKELLKDKVKPIVETFLCERGLHLSEEKTKITHITEGFNFLGCNIRKYNSKLIIKPSKESTKRFLNEIRCLIKKNKSVSTENLICLLNPKIRGWANYYKYVCSKETFRYIGCQLFKALWRWSTRRHPNKGRRWVKAKYFRADGNRNWVFTTKIKDKHGNKANLDLVDINQVKIKRHVKIRAEATLYNPIFKEYLDNRKRSPNARDIT